MSQTEIVSIEDNRNSLNFGSDIFSVAQVNLTSKARHWI